MNLKEQSKYIAETSKKKSEEEKRKKEFTEPVTRTDKDWDIISEYLRKLLIKCDANMPITVKKIFGYEIRKKFIYINCQSEMIKKPKRRVPTKKIELEPGYSKFIEEIGNIFEGKPIKGDYERIVLSDGKELEIYNEDIQRFCNQYNIELSYLVYQDDEHSESKFSTDYCGVNETKAYLICPKPMLRTDRELNIINEHLENLLKKFAHEGKITQRTVKSIFGDKIEKNFICIDIEDEDMKRIIVDIDGENVEYLEICNEDIERFCNQHNLKLKHVYEYREVPILESDWFGSYLAAIMLEKVKPIKYCIEIE